MRLLGRTASRTLLCALTLAAVALAGGCGDDPVDPPPTPVPTTITISPASATLQSLGETVELTATVQDQNGQTMTGVTVTWASQDNAVATVDGNGLVTAAGNGAVVVQASVGSVEGTADVTVDQQPVEVRVSPAENTLLALDDALQLSAEALDANGHAVADVEFAWSSADESVVTVDATGLATAVGNGTTSVAASVESVTGTAEVTVDQRPVEVRMSPPADSLGALGDTVRLSADAFDANGHGVADAEFTWASGDTLVVTVDATGLVTAVGRGSASVAATTGEVSGGATVTVEQRPFEVKVSPGADTLVALGDTVRLSAEALDANGHVLPDAAFMWASEDTLVVTVDASGLVTAVGRGSASVAATTGEVSGGATVTVEQRPFEVKVSPGADTLVALGDTVRLSVEALDANGHAVADVEFAWSSADESVVTVDATGLATAVGNGTTSVAASVESVTGTAEVTVDQRPVEVRMSPPADSLGALGDTVRLSADAFDANGHGVADAEFTWASGDTLVVTVDATGLVTAVGRGSASVAATTGEVSGGATVTVEQRPFEVKVSPGADTLVALGDTVRLSAEALDANGHVLPDAAFMWASEDTLVVTVDASGLVTAVGRGSASVAATTGEVSGGATVTVEQRPFEVKVSPGADTLVALGDTVRLSAEALDANGHAVADVEFAWSSADESVVTVDATGLATAVGNGTTSVAASVESVTGTAEVTVDQRPVEVRMSPPADSLGALGDTVRLSADAFDANGHGVADAEFTWASGDTLVVTVDATGLATAVGRGSASVTATTGEVSGGATVTVEQRPFEVKVSPGADTLVALGDTVRLSAEALDANGHVLPDAAFMWASEDTLVVTVDATGLVTAVANGSAELTASVGAIVGSAALTVAQRATEMQVSPMSDTLLVADTLRLSAEATDANGHTLANARFTWSSGDDVVATVDADGLVTGVAAGPVQVTVVDGTAGLERAVSLLVVGPREELVDVYEALGGAGWANADNWGTDAPLDEWYGVTTDVDGRITGLDLSDNGLTGPIPPELGLLESLEVLDLSGNGITAGAFQAQDFWGPVQPGFSPDPAEDLTMAALGGAGWQFDMASPGRFAYALQQQTEPEVCAYPSGPLVLGDGLTGSIPPALGALKRLRVLDLSYNSLTGSIPPELGNIESLEVLDLGWNNLSGSIPAELGELGNLQALALCSNARSDGSESVGGLTGSIPPELGRLRNLRVLDLGFNKLVGGLAGPIPPELGNLTNLQFLILAVNDLSGSIPPELGNLRELRVLNLSYNSRFDVDNRTWFGGLAGPIPPELGNLTNLEILYLNGNNLSGPIPPELGNLTNLEGLYLGDNNLSGPIPPELGNLTNLEILWLYHNNLSGSIPPELGNLTNLEILYLNGNNLSGPIPPELGNLTNLEGLYLGDNNLSGPIPPELGNLTNLEILYLRGNNLSGPIPPELGNLTNLEGLYLGDNNLSGPIPPELGNLTNLNGLGLRDNNLSGSIPSSIGDLQNLRYLAVQVTDLEGPLPYELINVPLSSFSWRHTNLCAPTDEEFQTWLQSIGDHSGGQNCSSGATSMSVPSQAQEAVGSFRHTRKTPPPSITSRREEPKWGGGVSVRSRRGGVIHP